MRTRTLIPVCVVIGIATLSGSAIAKSSVDDQVKKLAELYNQIEEQLNRSVHYVKKEESGGATTVEQAWLNGAGDPIKVSIERIDSSGRELTEYFARDLSDPFAGFNYEGAFLLNRKETKLPDGGTQVDESRKYFGELNGSNGELLRELKKSARFKAGESTDTVHTANVVVDLRKAPKENGSDDVFDQPEKVVGSLRTAGPPESDPFANVKGDSEKFRVIHGTASPDGRFAIALGFAGKDPINWDDLVEKDNQENGTSYYAEDEEGVRDYVVDLASQKILGETGCNYFGTRRRYNHRSCVVTWSPDSTKFVQLWDDKWASDTCVAGKINADKTVGAVDLDKAIEKKTYAFVKKPLETESGGGTLALQINKVSNDGVIDLEASEYCASGDCKGDTIFSVHEQLRLRDTPNGLRLDILNIRRLPNDQ